MAALKSVLVLGTFLFLTAFSACKADNLDELTMEEIPDAKEMPCKAAVSMLTKRMLGGVSHCSKTMKFKSGKEKAAKSSCIMRCVAIHEGLLKNDGYYSPERMTKFIKREVPPNLRERVTPILTNCFETHQILDQKDEFCKNYEPLIKCLLDKIPTFCTGL